jgi:hypothetical protein
MKSLFGDSKTSLQRGFFEGFRTYVLILSLDYVTTKCTKQAKYIITGITVGLRSYQTLFSMCCHDDQKADQLREVAVKVV